MVIVGRIEVRAVVRDQLDLLHRPRGAVGKVLLLQPRKELQHLRRRRLVIEVGDLRPEGHGVGDDVVLEINRQINKSARHN
jgi:hypothetical protein